MEIDLNDLGADPSLGIDPSLETLPAGQTLAERARPFRLRKIHGPRAHTRPARPRYSAPSSRGLPPWPCSRRNSRSRDSTRGPASMSSSPNVRPSDHKPIIALETIEQQLGFFAHLSIDQQRRFLLYMLDDADDTLDSADAVVAAWRSGDVVRLERLLRESSEQYPELFRMLTTDRNRRWLPTVTGLLQRAAGLPGHRRRPAPGRSGWPGQPAAAGGLPGRAAVIRSAASADASSRCRTVRSDPSGSSR